MKTTTGNFLNVTRDTASFPTEKIIELLHDLPPTDWLKAPVLLRQMGPPQSEWVLAEEIAERVVTRREEWLRKPMKEAAPILPLARNLPSLVSRLFIGFLPALPHSLTDNSAWSILTLTGPRHEGLQTPLQLAA